MTEVSKRFEHFLKTNISRYPLIPSKSKEGIHVGDVLIQSQNNIKNIHYIMYPLGNHTHITTQTFI